MVFFVIILSKILTNINIAQKDNYNCTIKLKPFLGNREFFQNLKSGCHFLQLLGNNFFQ